MERLAGKIGEQRAVVDDLYAELVDLVRSASAKGASRREVAKAAGLTYGRVQQILQGKYLASRHRKSSRTRRR